MQAGRYRSSLASEDSASIAQAKDRTWLAKVTNALNQHWQNKNAAKQSLPVNGSQHGRVLTVSVGFVTVDLGKLRHGPGLHQALKLNPP